MASLPHSNGALAGFRILSIALNLPGPAALARCRDEGASCTKLEPPAPSGRPSADPMALYCPQAYAELHAGVRVLQADLKTPEGQALLHQELAATDVLITSFRPSALQRLGLDWPTLQDRHPALSLVRIVGGPGNAAEAPGHDLTYQAEAGLLPAGELLPASLHADMAGALLASEAVSRALLARHSTGRGTEHEIALATAARWLALPRTWGLALPAGDVGAPTRDTASMDARTGGWRWRPWSRISWPGCAPRPACRRMPARAMRPPGKPSPASCAIVAGRSWTAGPGRRTSPYIPSTDRRGLPDIGAVRQHAAGLPYLAEATRHCPIAGVARHHVRASFAPQEVSP